MCVMIVGMLITMSTGELVATNLPQNSGWLFMDLVMIFGGLAIIIAAVRRGSNRLNNIELSGDDVEYVKSKTRLEYVLFIVAVVCELPTAFGFLALYQVDRGFISSAYRPAIVAIAICGLLVGVFSFLGAVYAAMFKDMRGREAYGRIRKEGDFNESKDEQDGSG